MIQVKNLYKEYRIIQKEEGFLGGVKRIISPRYITKVAVNNINFHINKGDMVGYIGGNGAGKSTTIKMLTGILTPTSGEAKVNNTIPYKERLKSNIQIGAVFGQRTQMWWDLAPMDTYRLLKSLYEIPDNLFKENLSDFIEMLDLKDYVNIPVRQLSLGQKMRCEIAAAFLHNPKVVFLDEPTIGLDVMVKDKLRNFIKLVNERNNATILLTTHDMQDIEEVCNKVIIIDNGDILYDGTISEIKKTFGKYRSITLDVQVKYAEQKQEAFCLNYGNDLEIISRSPNQIKLKFSKSKFSATDVMNIVSEFYEIGDVQIDEPSIESIVKDIYEKRSII